ncbi:MAG: L,D-transpeptidase [Paracoccaceae bacterium]
MTPRAGDLVIGRLGARFHGHRLPCAIGRGGIGRKRCEGDGITPTGCWRITGVGFRADRMSAPTFHGPIYPIGPADIWSDDPNDPAYNHGLRSRNHRFSHERLFRADPIYDLVAFLDFNQFRPIPGAGSALFLHPWRRPRHPTAGCIAFAPQALLFILGNWTPQSRVVIPPARSPRSGKCPKFGFSNPCAAAPQ